VRAGVHAVIGSSRLTDDDYTELDQLARDKGRMSAIDTGSVHARVNRSRRPCPTNA
jgi:hypothetical protein